MLQFILLCLCAVLINTAITPWFILLTLPIILVYYVVQRFYRSSSRFVFTIYLNFESAFFFSRELQRIENITCSPIISHFSETIQGVSTIRAFNQETRFMEILFKRMESNNIAFIILNTSNRWLGIALVNFFFFFFHSFFKFFIPSNVGLFGRIYCFYCNNNSFIHYSLISGKFRFIAYWVSYKLHPTRTNLFELGGEIIIGYGNVYRSCWKGWVLHWKWKSWKKCCLYVNFFLYTFHDLIF